MTTNIRVADLRRLKAYDFHKVAYNGKVAYEKIMGDGVRLLVIPSRDNTIVLEANGQQMDITDIVLMSLYEVIQLVEKDDLT